MTTSLERYKRVWRASPPQLAIALDTKLIHSLGITLFRTAKGDVISRGPIPAQCFLAAIERDGTSPRERWNRTDGPPNFARTAAPAPSPSGTGGGTTARGRPAARAAGPLLERARQLRWSGPRPRPANREPLQAPSAPASQQRAEPAAAPLAPRPGSSGAPGDARDRQSPSPPHGRGTVRPRTGEPPDSDQRAPPPHDQRSRSRGRSPHHPAGPDGILFKAPDVIWVGELEYVLSERCRQARARSHTRSQGGRSRSPPARTVHEITDAARSPSAIPRRRHSAPSSASSG